MAGKIIRGYWDCPQCGMKGIDGLVDTCPGCGAGKDKNVRYYMKAVEEVSEAELNAAGMSSEEADGAHKEWVCPYCGFLNNYSDTTCVRCGADKEEKEQEYGGDTSQVQYTADAHGNLQQTAAASAAAAEAKEASKETYVKKPASASLPNTKDGGSRSGSIMKRLLLAAAILLIVFLFWPHTNSEAITGFEWARSVTVEELQTFQESGWSLPYGARQTDARREFYGYEQVLDHYETVYYTREKEVFDHYDISYTYTDNGNGTFTENEVRTPVYRTETYEEPVQEPVYRNQAVYQTKYYYDIDRWTVLDTYETSGTDHDPKWSDAYTLTDNQRDSMRTEIYYTIYDNTTKRRVDYSEWEGQEIGDGVYVTTNLLGMEYSRREQG